MCNGAHERQLYITAVVEVELLSDSTEYQFCPTALTIFSVSIIRTKMKFLPSVLFAATLPILALSNPLPDKRRCANSNASVPESLREFRKASGAKPPHSIPAGPDVVIPMWFHVVSSQQNQDLVTDEMVCFSWPARSSPCLLQKNALSKFNR
jgi:hypothetical protein